MRRNYDTKLSATRNYHSGEIITGNYQLVCILCRGKCGNYRDTGVSKNHNYFGERRCMKPGADLYIVHTVILYILMGC